MNESAEWASRRQRLVRCRRHNLHYDPKLTSSCALCRKEGLVGERRSSSPSMLVLLLALLGLVFIVANLVDRVRADRSAADVGIEEPPSLSVAGVEGPLEPAPFRQEISSLEGLFYDPQDSDLETLGDEIGAAATRLSVAIGRRHPRAGREAREALDRMSAAIPEAPSSNDIDRARRSWSRIVRQEFSGAPWLRAGQATAGTTDTRNTLLAWRRASDRLLALADESGDLAAAGWQDASDWQQRLLALSTSLPARPSVNADAEFLLAVQSFDRAFREVQSLAGSAAAADGEPSPFEDAARAAEEARNAFDSLIP